MTGKDRWVTACIPTYRCTRYLRSAVLSLLDQTYPFLRVVVINDGDPNPPWPALADITDPRLLRFELGENRGPYFASAVALEATPDPFFLIQDADDLSNPSRLYSLLRLLDRDQSGYACSTLAQFVESSSGAIEFSPALFSTRPITTPGNELRLRIPHHGLFRSEVLKQIGGYFGGFPFGYDELLTGLLAMISPVSWTPDQLYWRRLRPDSLTRAVATGMRSQQRNLLRSEMRHFYRLAFRDYQNYLNRTISGERLLQLLRWRVETRRGTRDSARIKTHSARFGGEWPRNHNYADNFFNRCSVLKRGYQVAARKALAC